MPGGEASFLKCEASASARCPTAGLFAGSRFQVHPSWIAMAFRKRFWCSDQSQEFLLMIKHILVFLNALTHDV